MSDSLGPNLVLDYTPQLFITAPVSSLLWTGMNQTAQMMRSNRILSQHLVREVAEVLLIRLLATVPVSYTPLACDQCRKTKSKCERGSRDSSPCKSCQLTGTGSSCSSAFILLHFL